MKEPKKCKYCYEELPDTEKNFFCSNCAKYINKAQKILEKTVKEQAKKEKLTYKPLKGIKEFEKELKGHKLLLTRLDIYYVMAVHHMTSILVLQEKYAKLEQKLEKNKQAGKS